MEIGSDSLNPLERYEAATRHAREILIQRAAVDEHARLKLLARQGSNSDARTIVVSDISSEGKRTIQERAPAHACPVWLRVLLWTVGIGVVTFTLVLVAISASAIAKHFL